MIKPTEKQLRFLDWEMGMFFHFGIRSFFPDHVDWDGKPMPASAFDPKELDCRQWIAAAKELGCKYAVLVCKHHDGFANWPSAYTDYSVAASPWKDGKGDIVREFTDACREAGLAVGLYYSPAQWQGNVSFDDEKAYDDYFIDQITELLANYGKVDYLWFDACGSGDHQYDRDRIVGVIRSLQPDILIFNMWDPDTRWVGNEDGFAPDPNWSTVERIDYSMMHAELKNLGNAKFLPAECDMRLHKAWFYGGPDDDSMKSVAHLTAIYEHSVGRGANMLINVSPDDRGLIPEEYVGRLREFRAELDRRYGTPLPFGEVQVSEDGFCIEAESNQLADTLVIEEDTREGESIGRFRIVADMPCGKPMNIFEGNTVGHKRICRFPAVPTSKLTVQVLESEGGWKVKKASAFLVASC
ncbi:MAG: alpha-L-fucosidase [Oscillospiraceae bacterium]|nr:alpha-L-fucosidase [Oscillospiraceae bacterium]